MRFFSSSYAFCFSSMNWVGTPRWTTVGCGE
jgi:hypothetical protein